MLTSDLVRARVKDGALTLVTLSAASRGEAVRIADEYLAIARAMVGEPRDSVVEAMREVEVRMRLEKVAAGLSKLLFDACEIEADSELDPVRLREEVFLGSTEARRSAETVDAFDRESLLASIAARHGISVAELERAMFSDLKGSHRLLRVPEMDGERLLRAYELGQEQAVLLRAERVVVEVHCATPSQYRALFRKLKFLRLLYVLDAMPSGGYRITIDGPYSLFASTTKYGLELAMLMPLLRECDRYQLDAVVQWGTARERVSFSIGGRGGARADVAIPLPEELQALANGFAAKHGDYRVEAADVLLDLREHGVLVPDLTFTHVETGEILYLELLGHWSREAVWKRVDLANHLPTPTIFAVPSRLRVSEETLGDELPACLCTFKGTLRASAVHERLERLRTRTTR